MKVFLSHSTKDKAFVQTLAQQMQSVCIEPWLCEVDVLVGDDFVEQIERGLREADVTLLVWSPDAANSAWTGKEWRAVLAREVEESRIRLGLLLLRDAEIPELLRTKHRIDARTESEKAIQDTVQWLVRQRDMRRYESTGAANFIVDFEPTDFVGRTRYLEELYSALVEEQGKFLLWGGPGSGKSTLALKFAWRARGAFDAVVFQHCGQRSVEVIASEMVERLGLDLRELPPDRQIMEVIKWLCGRKTLLILDDIWNPDIKALIPRFSVASLSVLCTSRQRALPWIKRPRTLEVRAFVVEEVDSLFRIWLGGENVSLFHQDLRAFAERVERLPIAVAVAAEMLSRYFGPMGEKAKVLELERLRNEVHDVPGLLQEAINSQSEREQKLLHAMAVCHQEGFWLPLAGEIAGLSEDERALARDRLIQSSLLQIVDQNRQQFRLHALLQEQIRRSMSLSEMEWKKVKVLSDMFATWESKWKECKECLPEIIPALKFLIEQDRHSLRAWLASQGFSMARRVGELNMALCIIQQEEVFLKKMERSDSRAGLLRSYGNQALILRAWGRLEEAMELFQKSEALCQELGDKKGLSSTYGNQALILHVWGRLEEAMVLFQKSEALCEELGDKKGLSITYGNQALILKDWGKLEEAMKLHKKEEALSEKLANKEQLQRTYGNQALILKCWGRLEEAMALHKKKESLCLELGNKNGLSISYGNQALILQDWGRLEEAMRLLKKNEALCEEMGDKDGLKTTYGNQALILQDWGRLEEAMTLLNKQEALCKELGSKNSLGLCYWNLGLLAEKRNDFGEANEKLKAALAIFTELKMPRERDAVKKELERLQGES
jgi:tetratricopeptide (TPR) repeat protein